MMDGLIQKDLGHGPHYPFGILQLLSKWLGNKGCCPGKETAKERHIYHVLNTAEINKSKRSKGSIAFPVDLLSALDHFLYQQIGKRRFDARNNHSKGERMF
jgi:hypothetical protein